MAYFDNEDDNLDMQVDEVAADQYGQKLADDEQKAGQELEKEFDAMPIEQESNEPAINKQIQNSPEKYSGLMDEYKALQNERSRKYTNLAIIDAVSQVGQSLAARHTPNFKPKSNMDLFGKIVDQPVSDYENQRKQAKFETELGNLPLEQSLANRQKQQNLSLGEQKQQVGQFTLRDLGESRDPKSNRSLFSRMMAKKQGLEVTDDMSDWDVQNLLKLKQNTAVFKPQQSDYLSRDTGNPLVFKQETGQYVDAITGQKPSGVVRNVLSRDAMGNLNYMAGPGQAPIVGASSRPAETDVGKLNQQYEDMKAGGQEFRADDRQLKAITEEKKRLDKLTEGAKNQISAANSVLNALDSNSKLSLSVVKARMPRVMGEVGNLNQSEQEMWTGSQAWLDRIDQYLSTIRTSELTPENKSELKKLLSGFSQDAYDSYSKIRSNSSNSVAAYGIPPKYMSNLYGELPVPKSVDKLINREGSVQVREISTGKIGTIPAQNADAAVKSGRYEVVK